MLDLEGDPKFACGHERQKYHSLRATVKGVEGCGDGTASSNPGCGWVTHRSERAGSVRRLCSCMPMWVQTFCVYLEFLMDAIVPEQR